MRFSDLGEGLVDLMPEIRKLEAKDKRSRLQRVYYAYIKEPKPIDKLPKISLRGESLPKKQLRRIVKKWQKRLGLEKYLVIIEEVPEWNYGLEYVESETYARLFVIDKNGEKVESPVVRLDAKRIEAGDFVLIYIKFYLLLWPSHSLEAYEENVLHEFLHVKYPDRSEDWIKKKTSELLKK